MQQLNLFTEFAPVLPVTYYPDFLTLEQANELYQHCLKREQRDFLKLEKNE